MSQTTRTVILTILITLAANLSASAASLPTWHAYTHHASTFIPLTNQPINDGRAASAPTNQLTHQPTNLPTCQLANLPPSWHVLTALHTDLTHDGVPECALLVWRPWQDWPIMRWSDTPSPITANRDARGDSAHIILVEPSTVNHQPSVRRELWAGSALAVPIVQIAAGDVDGDGRNELVALEGDYATGRYGPARHVAVWRWNGFGFTLGWRGPPGRFVALALADLDGDGIAEILVR
jgi:hypothetical protein